MSYIIYCRKSSDRDDRQVLSLDAQEKECRKVARLRGFKVSEVYREAKSAKQPSNRPYFDEILKSAYAGKVEGIICWKLDRLARNPVDGGSINWILQQNIIRRIVAHDREYLPTDNVLLMMVEFGMANQFIIDLRKNTERGAREKAERGGWNHLAPFGYKNDRNRRVIVPDEERAAFVQTMFRLRLEGSNFTRIADRLDEIGARGPKGGRITQSQVQRYLSHRIYTGMVRYNGQLMQGSHKPLISKELFEKVQDMNDKRKHVKKVRHSFAFRGLFKCAECDCQITAEKQKGLTYYRCTKKKGKCEQPYIREEILQDRILDLIKAHEVPKELFKPILGAFEDMDEIDLKIFKEEAAAYGRRIATLNDELRKLGPGLDKKNLESERKRLLKEIGKAEKERTRLEEVGAETCEEAKSRLELLFSLYSCAKHAPLNMVPELMALIGSNFYLDDGKPVIKRYNEFFEVVMEAKKSRWLITSIDARTYAIRLIKALQGVSSDILPLLDLKPACG